MHLSELFNCVCQWELESKSWICADVEASSGYVRSWRSWLRVTLNMSGNYRPHLLNIPLWHTETVQLRSSSYSAYIQYAQVYIHYGFWIRGRIAIFLACMGIAIQIFIVVCGFALTRFTLYFVFPNLKCSFFWLITLGHFWFGYFIYRNFTHFLLQMLLL